MGAGLACGLDGVWWDNGGSNDYGGIQEFVAAGNPALVDLDPMAEWPGLSASSGLSLQVRDNPVLTDIAGLAGPLGTAPGDASVTLERLPALPSLVGLSEHHGTSYGLHDLPLVPDLVPLTGVSHLYWLEISGMPLVTSLTGLHELSSALFIRIGDCNSESSGMDGLTDLSGLDALGEVEFLSIVNNAALTSLAGAPNLYSVYVLDVVNDPLVDAADVAAFVAPMEFTPETCVGAWAECMCTPYES